jgi:hypothetical protein
MEPEEYLTREQESRKEQSKPKIGSTNAGRSDISSNKRSGSFSKRALTGKIVIEKGTCPYCFHKKIIRNISTNINKFNKAKCAKCKKWL